jgi:hypothetical protein
MKTVTFWTSVIIATLIIFAGVAVISSSSDIPEEEGREGYVVFEPMEITVPVMVFDFTDEPPMLITPSNGLAED